MIVSVVHSAGLSTGHLRDLANFRDNGGGGQPPGWAGFLSGGGLGKLVDLAGLGGFCGRVSSLYILSADAEARLRDWRRIHNAIIPTAPLTLDEVRERAGRNRLEVAYLGGVAVGCSTVRPPAGDSPAATVIARVLPGHRRNGIGQALYEAGLSHARALGATVIETIVLASNEDGLRFALARDFVEVERYVLDGDTIAYITLRKR